MDEAIGSLSDLRIDDAVGGSEFSPASAGYTPAKILIRVDLPAPFCPKQRMHLARRTSKSTLSSASVA